MSIIKDSWKRLWNAEEIRILVLVSLCLQFGLVFLSPLRKRTAQKLLILLLWSFYLLADYVAILALGILLKSQKEGASSRQGGVDLTAVWAPFLLLHLGGPDTITSYSIEDNELWLRHFLGLAVQVVIAFMVLLELVAIPRLRVAAAFVFIAGLVKYSQRTWALRSSGMDQLRMSMFKPGSSGESFLKEGLLRWKESAFIKRKNEPPPPVQLPSNIDAPDNIYDPGQIFEAYKFFKRIMPFVVDHRLNFRELQYNRTYFRNCSVCKAFKVVEIELSFLYDVLHTKAILINGLRGCLWRFVSLGMISYAFILFLKSEKGGFAEADIIISHILFGSALFMELISLLLIIISDWMIVALNEKKHVLFKNLVVVIAKLMSCFFPKGKPRWSKSMGQCSLLSFSLGDKETIIRWILGVVKVKEIWDNYIFIQSFRVSSELEELLFKELKTKSKRARHMADFKELIDCKGEKVLQQEACNHLRWSIDKEFDESILLWHIATDICFHTHGAMNEIENPETSHGRNDNYSHSDREISLIMSNYLVYLLVMQSSMMPDGIGKIRFQHTCADAKIFFQMEANYGLTEEEAREALLNEVIPVAQKQERIWSLLFDACRLAKELKLLAEDKRWRLIRRVWVEMLGYAAIHCKPYNHAKQLSQGGEFLTHVSLLMAHMGIGQQYRKEDGYAGATLAPL